MAIEVILFFVFVLILGVASAMCDNTPSSCKKDKNVDPLDAGDMGYE